MKTKLKFGLFILTAFSNIAFSEEIVWSKKATKIASFSKTNWRYESGKILNGNIPIANYVLQERISQSSAIGDKAKDYFMTVTFLNTDADSYVVLKGSHHLADKNYDGWVIAASEDQSALIDSTVSADEKTKQWRLKKATEDEIVLKMASRQLGVAADSLKIDYRDPAFNSNKYINIRAFEIAPKEGNDDSKWIYLFPNNQRVPDEFIDILMEWVGLTNHVTPSTSIKPEPSKLE